MHTDGISDAGTGPDRLGTDAMLRIAETNARQPAQVIADSLLCAATEFCESVLSDDAVVLVIKAVDRED
jgi:serine phosphatase RsbU (regulator of sigma subunit)